MKTLRNLKISIKLYLMILVLSIPLFVLTINTVKSKIHTREVGQTELQGLEYISVLRATLQSMQSHRGMSMSLLSGNDGIRNKLDSEEAILSEKLNQLKALDSTVRLTMKTEDKWIVFFSDTRELIVNGLKLEPSENFKNHTAQIDHILSMYHHIAETSHLILDSEVDTHYIISVLVSYLPPVTEYLGQLRGLGAGILADKSISKDQFNRMNKLIILVNEATQKYNTSLLAAIRYNSGLKELIDATRNDILDETSLYTTLVENSILNSQNLNYSSSKYFEIGTSLINKNFALYDRLTPILTDLLTKRVSSMLTEIIVLITMITIAFFTTIVLGYVVIQSITRPLQNAVKATAEISNGNLAIEVDDSGEDETGKLLKSVKLMALKLGQMINDIMQGNKSLIHSSKGLTESSTALLDSSENVATQSGIIASAGAGMNQNMSIVSSSIEEMSISVSEVSNRTNEAAEFANQANIMTQDANNLMSELGESAFEIGKVVSKITDIAEQTKLLALNAAIEAASAGEAGKGFSVVALEVKELAFQTGNFSEFIRTLISQIQVKSKASVEAIEKISGTMTELSEITTTIAGAVEQQAITAKEISGNINDTNQAANEVVHNINGIATITKESVRHADNTSKFAVELQNLSEKLNEIVSQFTINN
ncbi:MAG: methyl-accepting chemotaxis protein [Leptospirales bacterium]